MACASARWWMSCRHVCCARCGCVCAAASPQLPVTAWTLIAACMCRSAPQKSVCRGWTSHTSECRLHGYVWLLHELPNPSSWAGGPDDVSKHLLARADIQGAKCCSARLYHVVCPRAQACLSPAVPGGCVLILGAREGPLIPLFLLCIPLPMCQGGFAAMDWHWSACLAFVVPVHMQH